MLFPIPVINLPVNDWKNRHFDNTARNQNDSSNSADHGTKNRTHPHQREANPHDAMCFVIYEIPPAGWHSFHD